MCVDRWASEPRTIDAPALIAEDEDGAVRTLSFGELAAAVDRAAAGLRALGVRPGDAVGVFLPMVPEAVIAAYAIAKVGALWVPIFSGFAPGAVASRLQDAGCRVVVCADGTRRKGRTRLLKPVLDEALVTCPEVTTTIVVEQVGDAVALRPGRDVTWSAFLAGTDPGGGRDPEPTSSEHQFLLAYT